MLLLLQYRYGTAAAAAGDDDDDADIDADWPKHLTPSRLTLMGPLHYTTSSPSCSTSVTSQLLPALVYVT